MSTSSFIKNLIEFTKESETPTSFWKWGGYAIIAGALRDNVYWTQRGHKICPNIFVLLNADSAVHRKSGPIKEADALLGSLKITKIIRGRGSIQAILEDLGSSSMDRDTGKTLRGGSCLLIADELRSFFVADDALIGIMTDIYDYRERYDYKLRGSPFKVTDLCVSMLAASNDEFLKEIYTVEAVNGGLLGRTFLVKPDEYRPANSLLETEESEATNVIKYDTKPLIDFIKEVAKLQGKVKFDIDAKMEYDNWYVPLRESYRKKPDKTGVVPRMHTGVLKIAVILAIAKRLDLTVKKEDVLEGIEECMGLLPNYDGFTMSVGRSSEAQAGSLLINEMWTHGGQISKQDFLVKYWYEVSSETLQKLVITLSEAGMIQLDMRSGEMYVMTKRCREIFERGSGI